MMRAEQTGYGMQQSPALPPRPLTVSLMPWGRVGSNLVNSIVGSQRNVKVHNEPLTRLDTVGSKAGQNDHDIWTTQREWLEEHILNPEIDTTLFLNLAAVHIKDPQAFVSLLAPRKPVYIVQDRRDVAATIISALRTRAWVEDGAAKGEKRRWSIPKSSKVDFRPAISVDRFVETLGVVARGRAIIELITAGQRAVTYYYEDILIDMDGVIVDILGKARIPYAPYEVKSGRFGSPVLSDMVSNAAELSAAILRHDVPTDLRLSK